MQLLSELLDQPGLVVLPLFHELLSRFNSSDPLMLEDLGALQLGDAFVHHTRKLLNVVVGLNELLELVCLIVKLGARDGPNVFVAWHTSITKATNVFQSVTCPL